MQVGDHAVSLEDPYIRLVVDVPEGASRILVQVKLDDEGVVVDAFPADLSKSDDEIDATEPCASTWKLYQEMIDGD